MAASADQVISELQDMLECPVCLDPFKAPRTLQCQHSFCTRCLQGLLGPGRQIRCPCCNKKTPVPNGVQELPVDFRANKQLEMLSKYKKTKEAKKADSEPAAAAAVIPQDAFGIMSLDELCPVCEEILTVSKNLICGHSLCRTCVQFLLPVGGGTLHCPTCSRQTTIVTTPNTGQHTQALQSQGVNVSAERLTFHSVCGEDVGIHANRITAHRKEPQTIYSDALVLTSRHLKPNELFEVRLDKKVDKWLVSIKIGVTGYSPTESDLPPDISNLDSGTWYMERSKVWHKEGDEWTDIKKYKQNLYDLKVGDRVGVQRKVTGNLHFFINGADLGVAASDVPADVYGVISLFGKAGQGLTLKTPRIEH